MSPSIETTAGITNTKNQAAKVLHGYWEELWNQQKWNDDEKPAKIKRILEVLADEVKNVKISEGRPAVHCFRERLSRISGCAGADGWTSQELLVVSASRAASKAVWETMHSKEAEASAAAIAVSSNCHTFCLVEGMVISMGEEQVGS